MTAVIDRFVREGVGLGLLVFVAWNVTRPTDALGALVLTLLGVIGLVLFLGWDR